MLTAYYDTPYWQVFSIKKKNSLFPC